VQCINDTVARIIIIYNFVVKLFSVWCKKLIYDVVVECILLTFLCHSEGRTEIFPSSLLLTDTHNTCLTLNGWKIFQKTFGLLVQLKSAVETASGE
jgi:hypothetical protein